MTRSLLVGIALTLGSVAATAQQSQPDPAEFGAGPTRYFDVLDSFERWNADSGGQWHVRYEWQTEAASFVYGGAKAGSFQPSSDLEYFTLAREFLAQTYDLHRIEPSTLIEDKAVFLPLGNAGSSDKMTVRFAQQVRGVPVVGGSVNVLFDTQGRLLSIDARALPELAGFPVNAAFGEVEARTAVADHFRRDTGVDANVLERGELKILMNTEGKFRRPRLVWEVNAQWRQENFTEQGWRYQIDARDGTVLGREASVHSFDVSGTVTSMLSPGGDPDDGTNAVPGVVPYLTVVSASGNAVTDINGDFTIVGASAPLDVTVGFSGTYGVTDDESGAEFTLTTTLNSASGNTVLMNSAAPEDDTAEANAFTWVGLMRDWTVNVNPADTTSDFQALINVNQSTTCNATYSGSAVNFRAEGGGCVNSAYSSVVLHEMGHWLNNLYNSGNGGDGFGEGNADVFALYILDDPLIGKDFGGPGSHIRDADNANTWCGPYCYGGVHANGEPLMGAAWNVRNNLKATYGDPAGAVAANTLFNAWMNAYDDSTVGPLIRDHWLVLDDNNGNVNDGTPNFDDIDDGFTAQGFPPFQFTYVNFTNVIEPGDTADETGPYTVQVDLTPELAASVTGGNLYYRVDGGAFTQVPLSFAGGDTYTGDIPGQVSPAKVEWYLDASDNNANTNDYPDATLGGLATFDVGLKVDYFVDGFESGINGWTHGLNQTQDDWHRSADEGAPNGTFGKAGDPQTAYAGVNIWGNDIGPSGFNGAYGNDVDNWLRSPTIDLTGAFGSKLRFRRWLTVEESEYDQARVLANGVELWVNPFSGHVIDQAWVPVELDLSAFDGDPAVTIEFTLTTDGGLTMGGWNIDDVEIITLTASSGSGISYCTAGTSANGCQATMGGVGTPSASSASGYSVTASGVEGNNDGLFFLGTNGRQANSWGNGTSFQCVVPPVKRTPLLNGTGTNGSCDGSFAFDLNTHWNTFPAKNPGAGALVQTQFWYRDPLNTSNQTTSLSDALEFTVAP